MKDTCVESGWKPDDRRYSASLSELMRMEMGGLAEDELNHSVDRRKSLDRWDTCTLGREQVDTKGGVPQVAAVKRRKICVIS